MGRSLSNRKRGFAHERDLARRLWERGFAVMRAPASGSKAKRVLYPDVVAIMNGQVFAFEVKSTRAGEKTLYIQREQVQKLVEFVRRSGGSAFIAVKIVGRGEWMFVPVKELVETSGGNYKLSLGNLREGSFLRIDNLVAMALGVRPLREFLKS
ncbi:Holliday junction resolvase Hjc [Thermogladius sp. KZ2Tp1]|uniref:Holliday junction resolvase Hjc n=1 Tax=Thermogladius sp. KZ2Tp1 TaxID=3136289 RepID=UPI003DA9C68D